MLEQLDVIEYSSSRRALLDVLDVLDLRGLGGGDAVVSRPQGGVAAREVRDF